MHAHTIDKVISRLDDIIEDAKAAGDPAGYFAALYRKVTRRVKEGILQNEFEDGPRMERLDVLFANRYLTAYEAYYSGQPPTHSWRFAFEKTNTYWPIVLQHLLWGINAHINLDLGIAAVETAPGASLTNLKNDFDQINALLAQLVGEVEKELSQIWPTLKFLSKIAGKMDDFLVNFSMQRARDGAWKFATELNLIEEQDQPQMIAQRDARITEIAAYINPPNLVIRIIFGLIRWGERGTIRKRIEILE